MTILYPEAFRDAPAAGFDGVWDWDFLRGAFPRDIMPMDIDGAVEIRGEFLVFETKDIGVPVPKGQQLTLRALGENGKFTVVTIWGKLRPVRWKWCRLKCEEPEMVCLGTDEIWSFAKAWADAVEASRRGRGLSDILQAHTKAFRAAVSGGAA